MVLSKEKLFGDLVMAFYCAKANKATKSYVKRFEENLNENLKSLRDDLYDRKYVALPSTCFLVVHPKLREIFAAEFRDRIVHHLIFNYLHKLLERTFIYDSYSCIRGKGTHFGAQRLRHHIESCSQNYTKPCYIMKLDISGYFMHIDRQLLFDIAKKTILSQRFKKISKDSSMVWDDILDIEFILYLIKEVILLDPTKDCIIKGNLSLWNQLPKSKSLFHSPKGCGLPIGNLTSQLFSNVYLNEFDQFVKKELHCKHYGRYVDDSYIVHEDKNFLHAIEPMIEGFLKTQLRLDLNRGKTHYYKSSQGVEFLGAFIKPNRTYISNQSKLRMEKQINSLPNKTPEKQFESVNSFLGVLCHYKTFGLRKKIVNSIEYYKFATIDQDYLALKRHPWVLPPEKEGLIEEYEKRIKNS